MIPLSQNITDIHGSSIEGTVDGVVNFNSTGYIFANGNTYVLDDNDGQVVQGFESKEPIAENLFQGMPLNITGATELTYPRLFFFKGVRYYNYDAEERKVIKLWFQ